MLNSAFDRRDNAIAAMRNFVGPLQPLQETGTISATPYDWKRDSLLGKMTVGFAGDVYGSTVGKLLRDDGLSVNPFTNTILSGREEFDARLGGILLFAPGPKGVTGLRQGGASSEMRLSSTGGRNTVPLTQSQIDEATNFSRRLGFDGPVDYRPLDRGYNTSYSDLHWLMISDDLLPNLNGTMANSRMSWRAALGHEIVGHGEANLAGRAFAPGSLLDEVQASARASRLTPELSNVERFQLRRDAIERIQMHNQTNGTDLRWRDIRDQLWLDPKN